MSVRRAAGAEVMVAHLKLLIAKLKRDRFGASSERSRKLLDQLEMHLEDLETEAAIAEAAITSAEDEATAVRPFSRASRCGRHCPRTCRVNAWCCRPQPPVRAAAAVWRSWARRSPRRWR